MILTDTHTHLYAAEFDQDRAEMVQRAIGQGVSRLFLPNIDSTSIEVMLKLEEEFPGHCHAMMGLHPCSVKDNYEEELVLVRSWLEKRPFCAVGEIGIDLYWDKTTLKQQQIAFKTQIEWAIEYELPIVIHSRESFDEIYDVVKDYYKGSTRIPGIFHCFTGNAEQAAKALDLGFYLGIGGVLTFKNSGLESIVDTVPLDRLVLETDSPYLAPVPYRGKRNESAYIVKVAERLADIKRMSLEELARITTENSKKIFAK